MNNARRRSIGGICDKIDGIIEKLNDILSEELDSCENMISDLQRDRSVEAQECIDDAVNSLSEAVEYLREVLS